MSRIMLVDGDELAYGVALKYERTYYEVYKDDILQWRYRLKEESIESIGNREDLEIVKKREALDPVGYKEDLERLISKYLNATSSTDLRLYLSGNNNFRYNLATLQPYKGTRDDSTKPFHLKLVKDRIREMGGVSTDYLEADDMMSSSQSYLALANKESIICSSDKDLRTVPGLNYNIGKGKITNISKEEADYNFFYQLLIGDTTDNIPSPYGIGDVGARVCLEGMIGKSQKEYYDHIIPYYHKYLSLKGKDGKYRSKWYSGQDIHQVLWEVGNLLFMHRTLDPGERWKING